MTRNREQLDHIRTVLEQRQARIADTRAERNALIVALVLEDGYTYQEAADIAGLSLPAVAKIVKAAGVRHEPVQR